MRSLDAAGLDLLTRCSLEVRNLAYLGPDAPAFTAALGRRNPLAAVAADLDHGPYDLIAVYDLADADPAALAKSLSPGGWLTGGFQPGDGRLAALQHADIALAGVYPADVPGPAFDDLAARAPLDGADQAPGPRHILVGRKGDAPPPPLPLRIVTYAPRFLDVRTRLPAQALRADASLAVTYQPAPFIVPRGAVVVLQRPAVTDFRVWRETMAFAIHRDSLLVIEVDDTPNLIASIKGRTASPEDMAMFGYPHAVQTSTEELGEMFRKLNPEVAVFPNAVFDLPPFPPPPPAPRIFYGALPRGEFPVSVAASLGQAIAAFPEAAFTVVGDRAVFDALPTAAKTFHDYLDYEPYLDEMARCSILLTPLQGALYAAKSDVKFLDASSRGLLTIASPQTYAASIRHGETGLIAQTQADWSPMLISALSDPAGSRAMARRAWEEVRGGRMFAHQAAARAAWYRSLNDRRAKLNAAAMDRIPGLAAMVAALGRGERI